MSAVRPASAAATRPASTPVGESEGAASSEGAGPTVGDVLGRARTEERAGAAALRRLGRSDADDEVGLEQDGWIRTGGVPSSGRGRSSSLVASCTSTVPRKSRAPVGRMQPPRARAWPARRSSPPAIRIVCFSAGIPSRSSSSITAATACWRGSMAAPGSGSERGSTTIVTRPPRVARSVSRGPESG